jgi:hypothetical protein
MVPNFLKFCKKDGPRVAVFSLRVKKISLPEIAQISPKSAPKGKANTIPSFPEF